MSRWMTPARWHWMTASTTWRKKFLAAGSGKAPRSVIKSNRSCEDSALSITKTKTSSASQASSKRTTPGTWATWRRRQNSSGTLTPFTCVKRTKRFSCYHSKCYYVSSFFSHRLFYLMVTQRAMNQDKNLRDSTWWRNSCECVWWQREVRRGYDCPRRLFQILLCPKPGRRGKSVRRSRSPSAPSERTASRRPNWTLAMQVPLSPSLLSYTTMTQSVKRPRLPVKTQSSTITIVQWRHRQPFSIIH